MLLHLFDRGVEKITGGYAALLRRIVTRRALTLLLVIAGFGVGIYFVNTLLPAGFIPLEDQGMIYGIIQTPPGSTLEYTNAKSHELQDIAKRIDGVNSTSSLAGYEVLTEGRGSNAGTCLINLKDWSNRKLTSKQIIQELEHECRTMTNVKLDFFEPPAVPGFGAAGILVGQYESFTLPLAVILSLPVGIFGSFLFLQAMGLANDVYCQIGLVMLVGLLTRGN